MSWVLLFYVLMFHCQILSSLMCGRNRVGEVCCKATHPCRGSGGILSHKNLEPTETWFPAFWHILWFFKASHWCKSKFENSYFMSLIPVPKVAGENSLTDGQLPPPTDFKKQPCVAKCWFHSCFYLLICL